MLDSATFATSEVLGGLVNLTGCYFQPKGEYVIANICGLHFLIT